MSRPKKYICPVEKCGKAYSRPSLLEQHRRSHTNERPFSCDVCGKSFLRKSHLKVHQWTHSDEKPLSCTYCSKGFVTGQQLKRHLSSHSKMIICPYHCGQAFEIAETLNDHILQNHIISDILTPLEMRSHSMAQFSPFSDGFSSSYTTSSDNAPDSIHCKEWNCRDYGYQTVSELISHYDLEHHFVPETLFGDDWNLVDRVSAEASDAIRALTENANG